MWLDIVSSINRIAIGQKKCPFKLYILLCSNTVHCLGKFLSKLVCLLMRRFLFVCFKTYGNIITDILCVLHLEMPSRLQQEK